MKDATSELFDLLAEVGATPTLDGKPITEAELREHATKRVVDRLANHGKRSGPARAYADAKGFRVVCISLYTTDIEQLEAKVAELKRRGWTRANKSQLIRLALAQLDLD
ncbi:MAG TPA: hypothetical protein VHH11_03810, partial [Gammaproteobacteria bacterium]|nr:hypothetical protein [Gammaproteobacteria bacterium]